MSLESFLIVGAILFAIGLYGALSNRNAITVLMSLELMFNAVNVTAVALSRYVVPARLVSDDGVVPLLLTGQVFAVFIITVAARGGSPWSGHRHRDIPQQGDRIRHRRHTR